MLVSFQILGKFHNKFIHQTCSDICLPFSNTLLHFIAGNRCLGYNVLPPYMSPAQPGGLMQLISPFALPPAEPPNPVLTAPDVVEGPLPSHTASPPPVPGGGATAVPPGAPNGLPKIGACIFLSNLAMLITILLLL